MLCDRRRSSWGEERDELRLDCKTIGRAIQNLLRLDGKAAFGTGADSAGASLRTPAMQVVALAVAARSPPPSALARLQRNTAVLDQPR